MSPTIMGLDLGPSPPNPPKRVGRVGIFNSQPVFSPIRQPVFILFFICVFLKEKKIIFLGWLGGATRHFYSPFPIFCAFFFVIGGPTHCRRKPGWYVATHFFGGANPPRPVLGGSANFATPNWTSPNTIDSHDLTRLIYINFTLS